MNTEATRLLAVGLAVLAIVIALLCINGMIRRSHRLSVTFLGSSEQPAHKEHFAGLEVIIPEGDYAVLGVTNNGTRSLRFDSRIVEYESNGHWITVIPTHWSGLHGSWWDAGYPGSIIKVSRPSEVPRQSRWRIHYVCAFDVSRDVGFALRRRLNQIGKTILKRDTLAFCAPVVMVSPEILPAIAQPDGSANGSQPIRSETNRPPAAAGSGR